MSDLPAAAPAGLWCVIPVFNNAATVAGVARACRERVPLVLVVDDGSTDASVADLLAGADIAVVRHPERRGKGRALATALAFVRSRGGRWMLTIDADGQHLPEDIPLFFPAIAAEPEAIVIGARDLAGANVPESSRFGRSFSNFWVLLETGQALPDTQSGFRAYPVDLISRLPLRGAHYDFEIEVLVRGAWAGLPIRSVPVQAWYPPPADRISHFDKRRDNARLSRMHARLVLRRLAPWPTPRLVAPPPRRWKLPHVREVWRRMVSTNATPAGLAVSAGIGVLIGALPLLGLHSALIVAVAMRLHLNPAAALVSQNLCIPPFVPVLCIQIGHVMLTGSRLHDFTFSTWVGHAGARLLEWLLGSLIVGPVLGIAAGLLAYPLFRAVRARRP